MDLINQSCELSEQLKAKLMQAESERTLSREELKQAQAQLSQYNQLLASLKCSHQAKLETVQEFKQALQEFGVHADEGRLNVLSVVAMSCKNVYTHHAVVRVNTNSLLPLLSWK